MVYLLKNVIFHGYVSHNQMVYKYGINSLQISLTVVPSVMWLLLANLNPIDDATNLPKISINLDQYDYNFVHQLSHPISTVKFYGV